MPSFNWRLALQSGYTPEEIQAHLDKRGLSDEALIQRQLGGKPMLPYSYGPDLDMPPPAAAPPPLSGMYGPPASAPGSVPQTGERRNLSPQEADALWSEQGIQPTLPPTSLLDMAMLATSGPEQDVGIPLSLIGMVKGGGKPQKAKPSKVGTLGKLVESAPARNPALAHTFEEKFNYSGPYEPSPFPQYDWRKYDFTVPGVDLEQSLKQGQRVKVPLSELNSQQANVRKLDLEHVTAEPHPPVVVKKGGKLWIQDGHHRLAQAYARGDKEATVIVVDKDKR